MGLYINKGNAGFRRIRNSEYVDKSGLIAVVNQTLFTQQMFSCVTRSRRFGKSMAANMLAAYYDQSCDSRSLFADLQIASDPTFEKHLNKYPVIYLDMTRFTVKNLGTAIVDEIEKRMLDDITAAYPDIPHKVGDDLMDYLVNVSISTGQHFVFIIDEWDAVLREYAGQKAVTDAFVNWLRRMFKDASAVEAFAAVYMTGILPMKKYKTQSALNNFQEYSMVKPGSMARFFGFTKDEVKALATKHGMDFCDLEKWYDGYQVGDEHSVFNPNSVMTALRPSPGPSLQGRGIDTSTIESLKGNGNYSPHSQGGVGGGSLAGYISRNFDGLKDCILQMLAGGRCWVDSTSFRNDLSEINSRDDVLTVLIHLGYLSYDRRERQCYVPNLEVSDELRNAVKETGWTEVAKALDQSGHLLQATLDEDAETVARLVEAAHSEHTSILSYYNENSMACVLSIAYYSAHGDYIFHRELASGKGFADIVLMPRKHVSKPAIILELKCDKTAKTSIDQIKEQHYPEKLAQYTGEILLVGINFDKKKKQHSCIIERMNIEK